MKNPALIASVGAGCTVLILLILLVGYRFGWRESLKVALEICVVGAAFVGIILAWKFMAAWLVTL